MRFFNSLSIARKLPAIIVTLCLSASLVIGVVGYLDFQRNILNEARKNFTVITQSRGDAMQTWFENLGRDVVSFGTDPTFVAATTAFNSSYTLMIDSDGLQAAYITNNPNPDGARDLLDQAPDTVPYHFHHGQFHPYFRQIKNTDGLYDLFLFNLEGDLMYSVDKGADYATNVISGPFAGTGLGDAYVAARDGVAGQVYFSDFAPYAPIGGRPAAFMTTPITDDAGQIIGVVGIEVPVTQINKIINNPIGLGETGELYVIGEDRRTRSASRFENGHTVLDELSDKPQVVQALQDDPAGMVETIGVSGLPVLAQAAQFEIFGLQWGIIGEINQAEVYAPATAVRNKILMVSAVVAMLSIMLGWLTARSFVRPLERLKDAMQQVSDKNYDIAIDDQTRGDEIGSLSRALVTFRDKLRASDAAEEERAMQQAEQSRVVARLRTALTHLAEGDLTKDIQTAFVADYDALRQDYNKTLATMGATLEAVVSRTGGIRQRADSMRDASDDLSRRTENQAATLEQTAAALDEMTTSVTSAASGARKVENIVADARKDAQESAPAVKNAVTAMTAIEQSSEKISKIIGVIDDIAFQTNLLALNAGVEAARAGEAGRGFAVVASEVRALAQRSSEAAKQIKELISDSAGQVARGVDLVGQAGHLLTQIAGHVDHISGLIGEIAAGAEEQSIGLGEINIGVTQLDKVTQQNAAMVEQVTANTHALNSDAADLADLVTRFRLGHAAPQDTDQSAIVTGLKPFSVVPAPDPRDQPSGDTPDHPMSPRRAVVGQSADLWQDF